MENNIENLHIKELLIDNYKSLKQSKIELKSGLNIIIGKNGAGKSNLLEFINQYASRNIYNIENDRFKRNSYPKFSVTFEYSINDEIFTSSFSVERIKEHLSAKDLSSSYEFTFNKKSSKQIIFEEKILKNQNLSISLNNNQEIKDEMSRIELDYLALIKYNDPIGGSFISEPKRFLINKENEVESEVQSTTVFFYDLEMSIEITYARYKLTTEMKENTALLKESLIGFIADYFHELNINEQLRNYSPIAEIRVNENINIFKKDDNIVVENLFIEFLIGNEWLPWSFLSDGTKRMFLLISECINGTKGLILIEEPGLGVHPHQLFKIMEFLKEQSKTKQIIITTHSPMVLDILQEDELDRITIAEYHNGTKFIKLDNAQINKAKRYMEEVGELSYYWLHSDLEK